MKKIAKIVCMLLSILIVFGTFSVAYAKELSEDEKAAFIVREEWTAWVNSFTASLSELDKNATAKIYADMDFYDMQYRFTEKYKKTPEYLDSDGKPTETLKQMIRDKRKEINKQRTSS